MSEQVKADLDALEELDAYLDDMMLAEVIWRKWPPKSRGAHDEWSDYVHD